MIDYSYSEVIFAKIQRDLPFWKPNISLPWLPSHPKSHIYLSLQAGQPVLLKVKTPAAVLVLLFCRGDSFSMYSTSSSGTFED